MNQMKEIIKSLLVSTTDIDRSYEMGRDCALNGVNAYNCHFSLFSSIEQTEAWNRGKRDAEQQQFQEEQE